jgi:hypothetical protein
VLGVRSVDFVLYCAILYGSDCIGVRTKLSSFLM